MSGKKIRLLRNLLGIALSDPLHREEYRKCYTKDQSTLNQKLIIDGTEDQSGGGSRIEYTQNLQVITNEDRELYRKLKRVLSNSKHDMHHDLVKDLKRLNNQSKQGRMATTKKD